MGVYVQQHEFPRGCTNRCHPSTMHYMDICQVRVQICTCVTMASCFLTGTDRWWQWPKSTALCVSLLALPNTQNTTKTGGDTITVYSSFNAKSPWIIFCLETQCHGHAMDMQILMTHHKHQTFPFLQFIRSAFVIFNKLPSDIKNSLTMLNSSDWPYVISFI
jgi:hypothetical protein